MERVTADQLRNHAVGIDRQVAYITDIQLVVLRKLLLSAADTLDDLDKDIAAMENDIENLEEELLFARCEH